MRILKNIKVEYPSTETIDPKKVLCDKNYCKISIDGVPIYADNQHMNFIGSEHIGQAYLKKYGNPLNQVIKQKLSYINL